MLCKEAVSDHRLFSFTMAGERNAGCQEKKQAPNIHPSSSLLHHLVKALRKIRIATA